MDPVSALGVAASVVQFIDFTETLFSGTYQIYKSATGQTKFNFDLMTITTSLNTLNKDLRSSLHLATLDGKPLSKVEAEIDTICRGCSKVADQLLLALETLKAQEEHNFWDSFRKALQTVWYKKEVEALVKQLETFRMQISLHINVALRYNTRNPLNILAD
jgi:N-terminal domain on NACHT_NTPase and P-loop NTPases